MIKTSFLTESKLPHNLVLPVSGQGMVEQLGIMMTLSALGYRPEVCLGASGGALVSALGTVFDWNVEEISKLIRGFPDFKVMKMRSFGPIEGLGKPSFYTVGCALERLFRVISDPRFVNTLRENEILISTNNNTKGRVEIYSTVVPEKSILYGKKGPLSIVGTSCMITYLGLLPEDEYGPMINHVLRATSAVPIVFPPYSFNGDEYFDGGVSFSSPLSSISMIENFNDILYVFPEDIDVPNVIKTHNVIDATQGYLSQVSRANYIQDRRGYLLTMSRGDCSKLNVVRGNLSTLEDDLEKTEGYRRFVELFPIRPDSAPAITAPTTRDDVLSRLTEQKNFNYRIFYL